MLWLTNNVWPLDRGSTRNSFDMIFVRLAFLFHLTIS